MSIQVNQIKGDIVELLFNPREEDLRVGENLCLRDPVSGQGLVVQVIEFRTASYPSLLREQLQLVLGAGGAPLLGGEGVSLADVADSLSPRPPLGTLEETLPEAELRNLKVAVAKIRQLIQGSGAAQPTPGLRTGDLGQAYWEQWDGWIPARDVVIERTADAEVFANCVVSAGNPLFIGRTLHGARFEVEGRDLEKVNIITGVKGAGKSHLAKVLLLQLIERGAPCIVFDINREYIHLPPHRLYPGTRKAERRGIIHLEAGGDPSGSSPSGRSLRLGIQQFGLGPLSTMMAKYGLPEVSAMYFENRVARLLEEVEEARQRGRRAPFIGIDQLIQMAEQNEFSAGDRSTLIVNGAIRSRLEALRNTRLFARNPTEATSLRDYYDLVREGGALVIDISGLGNLARVGFVQAIIETIKEICEEEIAAGSYRFPFVFFEEAHLYVNKSSIDYIVTRARHLGVTTFFVTNMIVAMDEVVLRQADNLFLLRLPFDDDVRHVAKSATTDYETMSAFVRRLRGFHALLIGRVTRGYPLIVEIDRLAGINTAGETKYFFRER
jgi:hypothetical protein